MRLRWLLLAVVTMSLPSVASARRWNPSPQYSIGAAFEPGVHAGRLVLAFYNKDDRRPLDLAIRVVADTVQYDWLTVELTGASTTRTLRFIADREDAAVQTVQIAPHRLHFERIDLEQMTADLPPGDYDVRVTWDGHVTTTTTFVPYRCGLRYTPPPVPDSPSKLPIVLAGLALLVGVALQKRAGTADVRVPCSPL
jgi:hypothetical protein